MKVLHLVTKPRPFFDNQQQALRECGVEVDTLVVPGRESQSDSRSITDYLRYYPEVLRKQTEDYDIVHANFGNTAPFATFQPTRPIVITYWGSDLMGPFKTVNSTLAHFFDDVILPSPVLAEYVSCNHHILPFSVDTNLFRPIEKTKSRSKIGWEKDKNYILFPYSKARNVKNYSLAKRVTSQINQDAELVTISEIGYEQMPYYMNASDAVLITSKRESGPMVVKEAALCNVPVVSTDVGFVSEVLSGVENSYVCSSETDLANRLEHVIKLNVCSDGIKYANKWGFNEFGTQLVKVYESVLSNQ